MTGIFLMSTQKNFQVILKLAQKFFLTENRISYANKHFSKKVFCMQNLIFCVHNIVLDTIIMTFIFFSPKFFLKNTKNSYFFCIGCLCMP